MGPSGRRVLGLVVMAVTVAALVGALRRRLLAHYEARRPYVAGEGTVPDDGEAPIDGGAA